MTAAERFWSKVEVRPGRLSTDCWAWTANCGKGGYGFFKVDGQNKLAHKWCYEQGHGSVPEGFELDHRCHNPACVRSQHLRVVTKKQQAEHRDKRADNTSGYVGVFWDKRTRKWGTKVQQMGKTHYFGYFADIEDANRAVVAGRNQLFTHNDQDRVSA